MLAIVAAAEPHGISREKILGVLWPETEEDQARHTLSQTVYSLRRDTGREWITGTSRLRLHPSVHSDIREFKNANYAGDLARAADAYAGPFLDGFYLPGAREFENWVEETRSQLQSSAAKVLHTLARDADAAGAFPEAVQWWRRLCAIDAFNASYAAGLIRALIASRDNGAAIRAAREFESRVRRELELEPDPVISQLTASLRPAAAAPSPEPPTVSIPPISPQDSVEAAEPSKAPRPKRRAWIPATVAASLLTAGIAWRTGGFGEERADDIPFIAIGSIEARDTAGLGPVLRDMLSTNLARVRGIQVVANSRLLELLPRTAETDPGAVADAARRAGASEIIEGELSAVSGNLILSLRRVGLISGLVVQGYTVRASDLYALTDSATAAIATDFELDPPADAVATVRTSSAVAYALYEQGLRAWYVGDVYATAQLMSAALARDSTFAMAAFYAWRSSLDAYQFEEAARLLPLVKQLATRTVDRERLLIEGMLADRTGAPLDEFLSIARQMTDRYPADPDGHTLLGLALWAAGDWRNSISAFNRSVAIDSAAGATTDGYCRVCLPLVWISNAYAWWDSASAAERTMQRLLALRPDEASAWVGSIEAVLRQGRRAEAEAATARANKLSLRRIDLGALLDRDLVRTGRLDELEARLVSELRTAVAEARGESAWLLALTLRNQGRLREARSLAANGRLPGSPVQLTGHHDGVTSAIAALEAGDARESARLFLEMVEADRARLESEGTKARNMAWHLTLAATALAVAGDSAAVRALADSVQRIGSRSSFGRDKRLHHFLHGLLLQHQNRHAEAVEAFQRALFSVTDGYTRINLELARSLVALERHAEAIAVLQPALRGGVDGGNTYVTHTELHDALAHAFEAAGQRDSADVHYAAVERAWRSADPQFAERYAIARSHAMRMRGY